METLEEQVARHYARDGLDAAIEAGLEKLGNASLEALAAVDEFHVGGRAATKDLAAWLELTPEHSVLDIGCGLGGTARYLAFTYGCGVTGVDLTLDYIQTGNHLTARLGMEERVSLHCASALDLPFPAARFDAAVMLHVGMNIPDKDALFREVARVLKPSGQLAVYDVMRVGGGPIAYPVPWAASEAVSFTAEPDDYAAALAAAGFEVQSQTGKRDLALGFFAAIKARLAGGAPPPLGLHLLMGADAPQKVANVLGNIERGVVEPVLMLARRV